MKTMDDYFNELRVSMKNATAAEAVDRLIHDANAEWAEQCKKSWFSEYTGEVLNFIKVAEEKYGVKRFRITDPNVAHECMRDNMDCINYLDVKLLTPEYIGTLQERNKDIIDSLLIRSQNDQELREKVVTKEFVEKLIDSNPSKYSLLPQEYQDDNDIIQMYLSKNGDTSQLPGWYVAKHPEIAIEMIEADFAKFPIGRDLKWPLYFKNHCKDVSTNAIIRSMIQNFPGSYEWLLPEDKMNREYALLYLQSTRIHNRTTYERIPPELKEDKQFVKEGLKFDELMLHRMSAKVRSDPEFCMELIKEHANVVSSIGEALYNGPFLYKAYKMNPSVFDSLGTDGLEKTADYAKDIGDYETATKFYRKHDALARRSRENGIVNERVHDNEKIWNIVDEYERQNQEFYDEMEQER